MSASVAADPFVAIPASGRGFDQEPWLVEPGLETFQVLVAGRLAGVEPPRSAWPRVTLTNPYWALGRLRRDRSSPFLWLPGAEMGPAAAIAYLVDPERADRRGPRFLEAEVPLSPALLSPALLRDGRHLVLGGVADGSPHLLARLTARSVRSGPPDLQAARTVAPSYAEEVGVETAQLRVYGAFRPRVACARVQLAALLIPFAVRGEGWALWRSMPPSWGRGNGGGWVGWSRVTPAEWPHLGDAWAPLDGSGAQVLLRLRGPGGRVDLLPQELSLSGGDPQVSRFLTAIASLTVSFRLRGM
jgi:hypothetical protein